jgi:hypothetical protein
MQCDVGAVGLSAQEDRFGSGRLTVAKKPQTLRRVGANQGTIIGHNIPKRPRGGNG